eukprot:4423968-Amphidinium_carterae.2
MLTAQKPGAPNQPERTQLGQAGATSLGEVHLQNQASRNQCRFQARAMLLVLSLAEQPACDVKDRW